jgi:16S rRNA U516 pseudouridylate synthase RsuA-like enzyme
MQIELKDLKTGAWRSLSEDEIASLGKNKKLD